MEPKVAAPSALLDSKTRFDALQANLKDAYKEVIEGNFRISGVLLIVLGWFAARENPLPMLCLSATFAWAALVMASAGLAGVTYLFVLLYRRAGNSYSELVRSGFEPALFDRYKVTAGMVACGLFGQYAMLVGIVAVIHVRYIDQVRTSCAAHL